MQKPMPIPTTVLYQLFSMGRKSMTFMLWDFAPLLFFREQELNRAAALSCPTACFWSQSLTTLEKDLRVSFAGLGSCKSQDTALVQCPLSERWSQLCSGTIWTQCWPKNSLRCKIANPWPERFDTQRIQTWEWDDSLVDLDHYPLVCHGSQIWQ